MEAAVGSAIVAQSGTLPSRGSASPGDCRAALAKWLTDPRNLQTRRNTTLTALQALATLNTPFVLKQCEHFAARLEKLSPDVPAQIESAYRLALSRGPTPEEKERLTAYARKHALANASRVLLNSTEFMFVD